MSYQYLSEKTATRNLALHEEELKISRTLYCQGIANLLILKTIVILQKLVHLKEVISISNNSSTTS